MSKRKMTLQSGRSDDGLRLTIADFASGEVLARLDLDAEQMWQLLGGGYIHTDGEHTNHFDRVGKQMQNDSEIYTRDMLPASSYDTMVEDAEQAARADRPGWDTYSGRRNNSGGVVVVLRRWE